ncbi:MAG: molybdopterin synthase sulfur carrier subunit [Verrucomicrobia bacterium]|nr:molybdopterin synthase sulfur carrier subunit [Verrucomicrobiota bacterium]
MAVSVSIPTPLRALTGQKDTVEVEAKDIQAMLASLEKAFPGIHERLVDEKGFLQNQQTPLKSGDEVSIVPAIAGG